MADAAAFRAQFPVFAHRSYLNSGTEGPLSTRAGDAAHERIEVEVSLGRCGREYFESLMALAADARAGYAHVLGCAPEDVALTGSTTDGVNTVLSGLDLRPGDEIVTTDEEHPGLLAPLGRARVRSGIKVLVVPFNDLANAVTPATRMVACSHVSWVGGKVVDHMALKATGVPFLLDGAQGIGAVPVDVHELGCDFYAGSGQKWLSGPEGSGALYVKPERLDGLLPPWPGYGSVAPGKMLEFELAEGTKRLDHGFPSGLRSAWALASMAVLAEAGWDWVHERAAALAASLADQLRDHGLTVAERGRSTLVSWEAADPDADVARLSELGIVVRSIPSHSLVRASVGAWNSEEELERLVGVAVA